MLLNNDDYEKWVDSLNNMSFDDYSCAVRDKILESNMDKKSKEQFSDCFEYVYKLYKQGKPLDIHLLKVYLELVRDYKNIKMQEFINVAILLSYCGFLLDIGNSKI